MGSFTRSLRGVALRTAFTLLYNQFAWAYDWVSATFFHGQWRAWQRLSLDHLGADRGSRVLELGFGTGDLQADLLRAGYRPVGVDRSAAMLRQARRKARRRRIGGRLRLLRAESQGLPFATGTFAAVVSTFPSEYIADPRTVAEVARVLRPGGRLVVVPGAWLLPVNATNRVLEGVADVVYGPTRGRNTPVAGLVERAFPQLEQTLGAHGFSVHTFAVRLPTSQALLVVAEKAVAAS